MRLVSKKNLTLSIKNSKYWNVFGAYFLKGLYKFSKLPIFFIVFDTLCFITGVYDDFAIFKQSVHWDLVLLSGMLVFVDNIYMKSQEDVIDETVNNSLKSLSSVNEEIYEQGILLSEESIREASVGRKKIVSKDETLEILEENSKSKVVFSQDIKVTTSDKIHLLRQYRLLCLNAKKKIEVSDLVYYVSEEEVVSENENSRKLINGK